MLEIDKKKFGAFVDVFLYDWSSNLLFSSISDWSKILERRYYIGHFLLQPFSSGIYG